jgi:hypothetical protein
VTPSLWFWANAEATRAVTLNTTAMMVRMG